MRQTCEVQAIQLTLKYSASDAMLAAASLDSDHTSVDRMRRGCSATIFDRKYADTR